MISAKISAALSFFGQNWRQFNLHTHTHTHTHIYIYVIHIQNRSLELRGPSSRSQKSAERACKTGSEGSVCLSSDGTMKHDSLPYSMRMAPRGTYTFAMAQLSAELFCFFLKVFAFLDEQIISSFGRGRPRDQLYGGPPGGANLKFKTQVSPPCVLQVLGCWPGAVSLSRRDICAKRHCGGLRGPLCAPPSTAPLTEWARNTEYSRARAYAPGPSAGPMDLPGPAPAGCGLAAGSPEARPRRALAAATESPARGPASPLRLPASLRYCDHTPPRCRAAGPGPMDARPGRAAAFLTRPWPRAALGLNFNGGARNSRWASTGSAG